MFAIGRVPSLSASLELVQFSAAKSSAMASRWHCRIQLFCKTLLVLICAPAYAGWVAVEKDYLDPGLQIVYIDPDTVSGEGTLVTIRQLTDYKWMQGNAGSGGSDWATTDSCRR
jgi:hypothetical protein